MAHFAKIENNIVVQVIVVNNKVLLDKQGIESETLGIQFCTDLLGGDWVQTSYNGNKRYNYAGVGYTYDADNDVFYAPQPYASWTLDTDTWQWVCPLTYPDDDKMYTWDEDVYQADNTKGWVTND